eukprot:CAMPEP_0201545352 /NCGR_PEP_ID=MMETSP0173_2-20130828/1879_1 /ASSEMBLY_ACC=CAM_ASM_000268 /TAXON_ID=218659 /ORGANISM="Vexillifera sp., Strain DIVA3 564/2" /LENGTH=211 /DNA_ID=CAMNT_0047953731 /DNA_START=394 /DNA_END=1027 /DNA_ORIENTATION=+
MGNAQRRIGNLPPLSVDTTEDDLEQLVCAYADQKKIQLAVDHSSEEDSLFSDDDDDFAFQAYKAARLEEMKNLQSQQTFGQIREIGRDEFKQQVTEYKDGPVVVLLYNNQAQPASPLLERICDTLAKKFPTLKFIKMVAQHCIPNYPIANCPTLLVYKNSDILKQWIGISAFGGSSRICSDEVEWQLAQLGLIKTSLEQRPLATLKDNVVI